MTEEQNRIALDFEAYWRFGEEMIEQIGKNHPDYADYRRLPPCKGDERNALTTRTGK